MRSVAASCGLVLTAGLLVGCGGRNGKDNAPASFIGVPWVLTAGIQVDGWQKTPPSATFKRERVAGFNGCNQFTAPFTVDGDALVIGTIASTKMACAPPGDAVERAYIHALERVARWRMDASALVLLDDKKSELLRYDAATPVGRWEVTGIRSHTAVASPLPGTQLTATFARDGSLSGSAGCNTYRTSYRIDHGKLTIDPPAATRKACSSPEGIMEQEAAYLAALPKAVGFRIDGASLSLLKRDGTLAATYSRATQH